MPELIEKLMKDGYTEEAKELKEYYRNAVIICVKEISDIPTGASKVGGFPDLPPEIEYPTMSAYTETWLLGGNKGKSEHYEKSAMQLVAQINLYELAESGTDVENLLPKTGMLYIFWSGEGADLKSNEYVETEVAEPDKTACHKVIYWDGDMSTLKRTEPPCPYYSKYFEECLEEYAVEFVSDSEFDRYAANEIENLEEVTDTESFDFSNDGDKMLGFPHGTNVPYLDENTVNLFQFDYSMGCLWSVYWIMKKEDLKTIDFSKVSIDFDTD